MRYIILFCLFLSVASAQEVQIPTGAFMVQHTIKLDTLTNDSTKVFTLPVGALIKDVYMMVDSSGNADVNIHIRGEETIGRYLNSVGYTFAQGSYTGLAQGVYVALQEIEIWIYAINVSIPPPQIRIIIEYRQL